MESKAAGVLQKGELLLDKKEHKDPLLCPTCGTEHHNHSKVKCRNRSCRSVLRPSSPPAMPTIKAPRHPLLSSTFQALLQQSGAVECLESKLNPKDAEATQVPEEEDEDMDDETPPEEAREQAEKMLENLKSWKADASVIKQQERVLANLPRPRKLKSTQPILDVGRLHQALSQTTEYHQRLCKCADDAVVACEQAVTDAQKALDQSKIRQADLRAKADRELQEIRALISKKQAEAPIGPAIPATQDTADQSLMLRATEEWLVKQSCPDHIKYFLMNHWNSGPPTPIQPTPTTVPTPSGAGVDLGGTNGQAAAWEAA